MSPVPTPLSPAEPEISVAVAASSPVGSIKAALRLLVTRRFGTFFFATLLSNLGTWAQLIAEPWLLLSIGASSFLIGLDSFALSAPAFVLTLVGGVLADRSDRRQVIAIFQSIQMLCPAIIVVLLLTDRVNPWIVIGLSLVIGITDALSMPAFQSIVPSIVSKEQIGAGVALNSVQFNLSRILGPALAGVLMAALGPVACFALSTASYLPFIGVAFWILPRAPMKSAGQGSAGARLPILSGVRAAVRAPDLRRALLTVLVTSLFCGPLVPFVPVLVKDAFHGGVDSFSGAVTAFGVGGVLGALLLLSVNSQATRQRLMTLMAIGFGGLVALVGASPWFLALPALLFVGGFLTAASSIAANAFIQTCAPAHLRGQSISLYMLAMRGGLAVGSLLTGAMVHWIGVRHALFVDGVIAAALQVALCGTRGSPK